MNPSAALYGAMNKERKPFTYTPGGLDLSQIKSERMAKRLIRNAMDQGVPEQPVSHMQSPPTPSAINVPNFNCLPVQVFPTFPLPINPKTLLKSRKNQPKELREEECIDIEQIKTIGKEVSSNECYENCNKSISKCFQTSFDNKNVDQSLLLPQHNKALTDMSYKNDEHFEPSYLKNKLNNEMHSVIQTTEGSKSNLIYKPTMTFGADSFNQPLLTVTCGTELQQRSIEEVMVGTVNNQNEVKAVESVIKTEYSPTNQNGDTNVEAAVTVKLPGKKSAAKTETKVEVVKKILSDGSTEEIKTTTTRTTINGKTEITTKTEKTIIPKENDLEDEEFIEEEEEEDIQDIDEEGVQESLENENNVTVKKISDDKVEEQQESEQIICEKESIVSDVIKNVTIAQSTESQENSEEEEEEFEEKENDEEIQNDLKESTKIDENAQDKKEESEGEDVEEEADDEEEKEVHAQQDDTLNNNAQDSQEKPKEVEPEASPDNAKLREVNGEKLNQFNEEDSKENILEDSADSNEVNEEIKKLHSLPENEQPSESNEEAVKQNIQSTQENKEEVIIEVQVLKPSSLISEEAEAKENEIKSNLQPEGRIPLREPSVPLEKVEDVEIKPIGQIISKSHTENTEIITTSIDKPTTGLSTQTAYNRIENIVTVNRTTKTLDHAYEQIEPLVIPTAKTYFAPSLHSLPAQSSRPYHQVYPSEPENERRHSLLLDRLSVDRQMPSADLYHSNYQSSNQSYEQNQWTQEPQSEVLTVSNVKPSTITKNQQWYQHTKKEDNAYNLNSSSVNLPSQPWCPQQVESQPLTSSQTRLEYQTQPQFQTAYGDRNDIIKGTSNNSSTYQQNIYPSYSSKPTSWDNNNINSTYTTPNINVQPSNNCYPRKESVESYQKSAQQFSASYVPPPWEQDSTYVPENQSQNYYLPQTCNKFANSTPPTWTPKPTSKFSKPKPTSYVPPAPNQSFVKPVVASAPPKLPGRKTYYSEYERRYISVPESTYIPTENKFQAQPDPSPKYYYDNNEPTETIEHGWRKELREFSEKTQSQAQSEHTLVKPPWEEDPKYCVPKVTTEYTPTPTWSQTLRPDSWRERSFESEFVRSKEPPRTNTLGRGRPQSSYVKSNISAPIPERVRGVSVDRYNPNNYKSPIPSEYPPVQSHTLDPSIGAKTYHNPNVPAYHSRASAEPREQSVVYPQSRQWGEARAPPVQSRSFKYLQWITGTED